VAQVWHTKLLFPGTLDLLMGGVGWRLMNWYVTVALIIDTNIQSIILLNRVSGGTVHNYQNLKPM
jgi:hypothetical protein